METILREQLIEALPSPSLSEAVVDGAGIFLLNRTAKKLDNPELKRHAETNDLTSIDLDQGGSDTRLTLVRAFDSENESRLIVRTHRRGNNSDSPSFYVTAELAIYQQGEAKTFTYDQQLESVSPGSNTLSRGTIRNEIKFALQHLQTKPKQ